MFRFLRIADRIRIVAGLAVLPFLLSGTEATSLPSSTTVSANGISPQDDSVASFGSAAATFSPPPLALRCWLKLHVVFDMAVQGQFKILRIATHGRGLAATNLVYSVTYNPLLTTLKSQLIKR